MWRQLVLGAWCGLSMGAAAAADADSAPGSALRRLGGDLFIAGSSVTIDQPVAGDLIAMGGTIDVDAPVTGDTVVAGGKVRLGFDVAGSIYAAGGQLTIHGKVGRNLRAAGGRTELAARSEVGGNVSIAGGQVRLHGRVGGHVQAAGGRVFIDGPVGGDVLATSAHVELGPNARIAGKLRYSSREALVRDPAAQVAGSIESLMPALGRADDAREPGGRHDAPRSHAGGFGWVWTVGLIVLAAALLWTLPRFYAGVAQTLRERLGLSVLLGFALLVCTPVAALVALVSLIGIPLGLLLSALYLALLPVGYVSAGIGLGDWGLRRLMSDSAPGLGARIGAAALALIVLALAGWVPWLGWLVALAALLAGLGALVLQARRLLPSAA